MRRPHQGSTFRGHPPKKNYLFAGLGGQFGLFRGLIRLSRTISLQSRLVVAQILVLSAEFWPFQFLRCLFEGLFNLSGLFGARIWLSRGVFLLSRMVVAQIEIWP